MKNIITGLVLSVLFSGQAFALECSGTEPFWGAKITEANIALDIQGDASNHPVAKVSTAVGMPDNASSFLRVFSDNRGPLATVIAQKCNDGMSDIEYPKEVVLYMGSMTLYGCCK